MADRVGQQLGNYRLLRLLGRGGFAEVYLGEHVYLNSHAALKVLHTVLKDEEQASFLKEAQTLVRLSHHNIVRVFDFAVEGGTPFLVMEYAPNGTLRQRYSVGSRLTPDNIVPYVQQIASALYYAHDQHLIHRDVKPENMLLNTQNEVLLSDFGLALLAPHTHPYSTHEMAHKVAGTSLYLAPEQLQGHPQPASDQYALGVVVYEWLCGTPPFHGTPLEIATQHLTVPPRPLRELVPELAPALEEVVLKALAKEPLQRFSDVQEFVSALGRASHISSAYHSQISSDVEAEAKPFNQEHDSSASMQRPRPMWKVPALFTSFIGREAEVSEICVLLKQPEVRLLTLLGPGGIGKTRLSVRVATEIRDFFADGICFVHLAAVYDPKLVIAAIAEELEIREVGAQALIEQVQLALGEKHLLLVLDNFEQVVAAATQIEELLVACSALKILVTSRVVLHALGEQEFPVSPLAMPDLKQLPASETLSQCAAVALFVQRTRAVLPSFQLTSTNAYAVAEICVRLDGLPLAIELAAARSKLLPPQALLSRLSQRLELLTSGTRTLPERQQTLRNTLQWSYDLLDDLEQQFFRRLSVFVGGWTLEAAESVVGRTIDSGPFSVLDGISSLLDKSLLLQVEREGEKPYLIMMESIREYGMECLVDSGEAELFQTAHAQFYLKWVEEAEPHLKDAQQLMWLALLEREQENLRAALQWYIDHYEAEEALRFCGAIWRFWYIRGYWSEGLRWLKEALALAETSQTSATRAKALCGAGRLAICLGDMLTGRALLEESVVIYREIGDKRGLAESLAVLGFDLQSKTVLNKALLDESLLFAREAAESWTLALSMQHIGWYFFFQDDHDSALPFLSESAAIFRKVGDIRELILTLDGLASIASQQREYERAASMAQECLISAKELGNKSGIADALYLLGWIEENRGEYERAVVFVQESLELARELGNKSGIARGLGELGTIYIEQGQLLQAVTLVEESLQLYQELKSTYNVAVNLIDLGDARLSLGDLSQAKKLYTDCILLAREVGSKLLVTASFIGLGRVSAIEGELLQAAHLFGIAEFWFDPGKALAPASTAYANYQQTVASVRMQLGDESFLAAWAEGKQMAIEQALALLEPVSDATPVLDATRPSAVPNYPDDLTAREVEVLCLIAQGWTNPQIADHLVISPRTVNAHLTSIYRKIRVSTRSAATRYAIEHHLI
jgi:predicted ATPase/serine/threonine protein kinase/DNA-binding CsgD family transcriptional regulator